MSIDLKTTPLWLDDLPGWSAEQAALPTSVDVLVVGAGYTGLNAAIEISRSGLSTVVMDAGYPGYGCSTRNGGQVSTSVKPSLNALIGKVGEARAHAIRDEGKRALQWIETRINDEGIDCDFRRCGRFHAAHTPAHYVELQREAEMLAKEGIPTVEVPQTEQWRELGTDAYFGGLVFPEHASLHPAKYHAGLLQSAVLAGAQIVPNCPVLTISNRGDRYEIRTEQGSVIARQVVIGTNGYTGSLTPWLRRRSIPIGSYIIATEELPPGLADTLFPQDRVISDTRKVIYYYRLSPDRKRVVFGGRVSAGEVDHRISAQRLRAQMVHLFPQLSEVSISHSWSGTVSYSFDEMAHSGTHDGMHYSMCYCGSGVSMASYLGMRMGQKVCGLDEGKTAFDDLPFPSRPLYYGKPWFLPPVVAFYRLRDQLQLRMQMPKE